MRDAMAIGDPIVSATLTDQRNQTRVPPRDRPAFPGQRRRRLRGRSRSCSCPLIPKRYRWRLPRTSSAGRRSRLHHPLPHFHADKVRSAVARACGSSAVNCEAGPRGTVARCSMANPRPGPFVRRTRKPRWLGPGGARRIPLQRAGRPSCDRPKSPAGAKKVLGRPFTWADRRAAAPASRMSPPLIPYRFGSADRGGSTSVPSRMK